MKFVADFHIHSHYSRATSKALNFENLYKWAQLKGVQVVGSGDLTHPGWLEEMREKLEPDGDGLFRLKDEYASAVQAEIPVACQQPVRFILSGEISNIYKKNDKTRKNHNVVFLPSLEAVEQFQIELEKIGNIRSDGRPILGLDAHDLLEMVLETNPRAYLIPAHIWTPWFSLFGSKSGFDTIEECFEDLTPHIFALETGLSSDPPMNWRLSALDRYTLVSNSDAHSPQKLAREANLFNTELSYPAIFEALKSGNPDTFLGTIEFFPEEGKYHYDGHRKCHVCWDPKTTLEHHGICPQCGKGVTVGVMHRIETLADRDEGLKPDNANPFYSLIPLPEILSEGYGVGPSSKRVQHGYESLLTKLGSELSILRDIPLEEIERIGGKILAEGIRRMRKGKVIAEAGFDGEFGVIKLFEKQERESLTAQLGFFPAASGNKPAPPKTRKKMTPRVAEKSNNSYRTESPGKSLHSLATGPNPNKAPGLNTEQQEAVVCTEHSLIIAAGPGTGKTLTLTRRIAHLLKKKSVPPVQILAITFTNKAAEEMVERLTQLVGTDTTAQMTIKTFHALCAMILREQHEAAGIARQFTICSESDRRTLLKICCPELKEKDRSQYLEVISSAKNQLLTPDAVSEGQRLGEDSDSGLPPNWKQSKIPSFTAIYRRYQAALQEQQCVDFDDLIFLTIQLFENVPGLLSHYQNRFRWISVDEYQDLNFAQYRLLKLLKSDTVNLCVIGDPDQAIYGFRGAKREYFLRFQHDFPDTKTLYLKQNYRSTQFILKASQQIITKSRDNRIPLHVWSDVVSKRRIDMYQAPTYKAEAEYVVHEIERMVGGTTFFSLDSSRVESHEGSVHSFGDFAVLYRLGAQSQPLFEAFQRSGIPYQIVGHASFYERQEIQEILAYLWLLFNPSLRLHLEHIRKTEVEVFSFLKTLRQSSGTATVLDIIEQICRCCSNHKQNEKPSEHIMRLMKNARPYENRLADFLETVALHKENDEYDPRADRVTLMTLHASKGLEFPVVFLVGCEETLLPYQRDGKPFDLDEERRLFYVGMTRAREKLILMHAKRRFLFGQTQHNAPSRFLNDIEDALLDLQIRAQRTRKKKKAEDTQLALFS
ncbi:hypothetical protein CSA56_14225 [candidate division KSB3 bacterium]|uniref:DNA 3'-5' helicase n=1 Tax=candidate division KSB3 bacterium TaxID=2044937 RepID=A0A2G6KBK2_9BACT|nr:MAG: hypothetical protein CSA56_14225 [candidate division KSB3 bacterium]